MARPRNSPKQIEAYRAREKKRHRRRRANPEINNAVNERRRERDFRYAERGKERRFQIIEQIFGAGKYAASVVSEENILRDLTRWSGPGRSREERLSGIADAILRAAAHARNPAGARRGPNSQL